MLLPSFYSNDWAMLLPNSDKSWCNELSSLTRERKKKEILHSSWHEQCSLSPQLHQLSLSNPPAYVLKRKIELQFRTSVEVKCQNGIAGYKLQFVETRQHDFVGIIHDCNLIRQKLRRDLNMLQNFTENMHTCIQHFLYTERANWTTWKICIHVYDISYTQLVYYVCIQCMRTQSCLCGLSQVNNRWQGRAYLGDCREPAHSVLLSLSCNWSN